MAGEESVANADMPAGPAGCMDIYKAFLQSVEREDLGPDEVEGLIRDAAGRLGYADIDPRAVAAGTASQDMVSAIVAAMDFPPVRAHLDMPEQALGPCGGDKAWGRWLRRGRKSA